MMTNRMKQMEENLKNANFFLTAFSEGLFDGMKRKTIIKETGLDKSKVAEILHRLVRCGRLKRRYKGNYQLISAEPVTLKKYFPKYFKRRRVNPSTQMPLIQPEVIEKPCKTITAQLTPTGITYSVEMTQETFMKFVELMGIKDVKLRL